MSPTETGGIVFGCTMAGMLVGMWLRNRLPGHHLDNDTQSSVKEVNGLIATMTALILGLVTASAQDSFTKVGAAVEQTAADIIVLDRLLARLGPWTAHIRSDLRRAVGQRIEWIWPASGRVTIAQLDTDAVHQFEHIGDMIAGIEAHTPKEEWLRSRALDAAEALLAERWGIFAGQGPAIPNAFLMIITFWLTAAFAGYTLFAPRNGTMTGILVVSAFSVACVIFLILELGSPFDGRIAVSGDSLRFALAQLGE
jgi:Protein of unknown function (DUF4239)